MVEVNNLTTNPVPKEFFQKIVKKVLSGENKKEQDLSVALVGQGRMRELNKKYRGKNRATDVLAFPQPRISLKGFKADSVQTFQGLGEIVICLREVKKNANRFNSSFKKELSLILIHGILHLLGYDHEKNKEEADKMSKKEEYYLSQLSF